MKYASSPVVAKELERSILRWMRRAMLLAGSSCASFAAPAGEVEVLHFWTSPGEAQSIAELKSLIAVRGRTWKDFAVVGGGGQNAMAALQQRVAGGNPPASALMKGPLVQEWAAQNALAKLDAMAAFDHWDDVLPRVVQAHVKHRGHYVAVPVNIHRANWLWSNADVLRRAGVTTIPATFDEFFAALDRVRAAGLVPIAHGGQPWQNFLLFESVVLGVAGAPLYQRAFVQLEPAALSSPELRRALETYRRLKRYTDDAANGRAWNAATDLVLQGRAAFQFMGDWAKGEFIAAGRQMGRDIGCTPAPGTAGAYSYVIDSFAMFQLKNWEAQKAQGYLAYVLLGPAFQAQFNRRKGSIPVRGTVDLKDFDDCARASRRDFDATALAGTLLPSVAVDMALPPATQALLRAAVSDYWDDDAMPVQAVVDRLLAAAATAGATPASKRK